MRSVTCTKTNKTRSTPQLTIVLNVSGHVIVDDMLDGGEVQALGGHVCCHKNILSPFTELSDRPLTLLLVYV